MSEEEEQRPSLHEYRVGSFVTLLVCVLSILFPKCWDWPLRMFIKEDKLAGVQEWDWHVMSLPVVILFVYAIAGYAILSHKGAKGTHLNESMNWLYGSFIAITVALLEVSVSTLGNEDANPHLWYLVASLTGWLVISVLSFGAAKLEAFETIFGKGGEK